MSNPTVERLDVHTPLENVVLYKENQPLQKVIDSDHAKRTMLTEWFELNKHDNESRSLTYAQIPSHFVWHSTERCWAKRKRGNRIGRIMYVHPSAGERYYLRMLLNVVKGATSFEDIRTVNGVLHPTFRSACTALGLLGDYKEWEELQHIRTELYVKE